MTRWAYILVALGASVVIQGPLSAWFGHRSLWIDLPLVATVYAALAGGRVAGLLGGTAVGLVQDAVTGGVLGIGGLAKSLAGFLAGVAGTQFIVTQTAPRLLVFGGATALHAVVFLGLYQMLGLRHVDRPLVDVLVTAALNGIVGTAALELLDALPGLRERWRARREYRQRARYR